MSESIVWIDASGNTLPLSGQTDIDVLWGAEGRFMPPVGFIEDEVPQEPGSRLREVRVEPREVLLPLVIQSANEIALRSKLRSLLAAFNPSRGDGRLNVTGPDGNTRQLTCRYAGGLELTESENSAGPGWQRAVAAFRAFDPYWYDTATSVATYTAGSPALFFPMFPMRLTSSEVFADATVDNTGDVLTWPVWEITGPGSSPVLDNITTGKRIEVATTLAAGESLTIDTRPGAKSVVKSDGTNLFGALTTSSLWSLAPGINSIRVELSAATAASVVKLTYQKRYLGA